MNTRFHFKCALIDNMRYNYFVCALLLFLLPVSFSATETQDLSIRDGYIPCDQDWFLFGEKCYRIFGKRNPLLNWPDAKRSCSNHGGHLATVYSKEIQDFLLVFLLFDVDSTSWIGLNDIETEGRYVWDDGSPYQYSAWNGWHGQGDPVDEREDCVEMVLRVPVGEQGEWNDHACENKNLPYICQIDKGKQGKTSPDPLLCPSPGGGGRKYRNSCYNIIQERMTWDDAEKYCQDKYKGHLVMILDEMADYFVEYILKNDSRDIWIGIKMKNKIPPKFSSGWYAAYTNWREDPQNIPSGTCIIRAWNKVWGAVSCTEKYTFICEVSAVSAPVLKNPGEGYRCPKVPQYLLQDWMDIGGEFCYFLDKSNDYNWDTANAECIKRGGYLASIHSRAELDALAPFTETLRFAGHLERRFFIGLKRPYYNENTFVWADGSPLNFTNWDHRQPDNREEKCGEMIYRTMKWNDVRCDQTKSSICSARKIFDPEVKKNDRQGEDGLSHRNADGNKNPATTATTDIPPDSENIFTFRILGVIGIVAAILLVVVLISLLSYHYCSCMRKIKKISAFSTSSLQTNATLNYTQNSEVHFNVPNIQCTCPQCTRRMYENEIDDGYEIME